MTAREDDLVALLAKATPGPWETGRDAGVWKEGSPIADTDIYEPAPFGPEICRANAALIVAAVNALPDILAENKALRGRVSALEAERDELNVRVQALREDLGAMGSLADAAEADARRCREGLEQFVAWLDRADDPADDCAYLNGAHPDQDAADRDGWDDVRDIACRARALVSERQEGGE